MAFTLSSLFNWAINTGSDQRASFDVNCDKVVWCLMLTLVSPSLALLVVIIITPFAPLDP